MRAFRLPLGRIQLAVQTPVARFQSALWLRRRAVLMLHASVLQSREGRWSMRSYKSGARHVWLWNIHLPAVGSRRYSFPLVAGYSFAYILCVPPGSTVLTKSLIRRREDRNSQDAKSCGASSCAKLFRHHESCRTLGSGYSAVRLSFSSTFVSCAAISSSAVPRSRDVFTPSTAGAALYTNSCYSALSATGPLLCLVNF
ncbi:hypothetical protein B0H15DRAFT_277503 [Mycena belliarum]|uniref:Uncharacterized protein n=1 Tax=Mycena belliarum TaxID=1033014 RepID=A0AAD6TJX8_9AGAR|nr:hypothetical protein B0H15DRAFT_277503 [Mycena belliae]